MDTLTEHAPAETPGGGPAAAGTFRVVVTKDYLVFAAAHFITFAGHRCESLHGHNYRVGVMLEGVPDAESHFVFDFVRLKKITKRLCDELDHRVLLPTTNPRLHVSESEAGVSVACDGRQRYLFPRQDCVLLPIPNTTVEMLAQLLAGRLTEEVRAANGDGVTTIAVEVEENFGQSAVYRTRLAEAGPRDRLA